MAKRSTLPEGKKAIPVPRALEPDEIPGIVEQFRNGAENAKAAGFDGVEIHGANGYLLDQFLRDGSNHRTDRYGGSVENRARLPLEVAGRLPGCGVQEESGTGFRRTFPSTRCPTQTREETFLFLAQQLGRIGIGYLHLVEAVGGRLGAVPPGQRMAPLIRKKFGGTLMLNGGYDAVTGNAAIEDGPADLVSFGVTFLANPDLPDRFRRGAPLNPADMATYYAGEEKGYTDYPAL